MHTRKATVIGLCGATLIVLVAYFATVTALRYRNNDDHLNQSQKAITDLCQNTYHHQTCIDTLYKATNSSDSKTLIVASFHSAIHELGHVIAQTRTLQEAANDVKTAGAYKTCQKLLDDAIYDLQATIDQITSPDISNSRLLIDNIKTWLTGALTYQETCLDCFEEVNNNEASEKMEKLLKLSRELTINGLALANEFSSLLVVPEGLGSSRRLFTTNTEKLRDYDYEYNYRGRVNKGKLTKHPEGEQSTRNLLQAHQGDIDDDYYSRESLKKETSTKGEQSTRNLLQANESQQNAGPASISPNVVVAKDGSGKYKTINEALLEVPQKSNKTFVIYIKEGVYQEYVTVNRTSWSVMFIGDGPTKTKVIGDRSKIGGYDTFWSSTVAIEGDNFIARDMGIENNAGPNMHQAVAVRVSADKTIFLNCQIDGFQDTLYAHNHRQYYRDCTISGTIDFIFGNARAVFQNCTFVVRKPLESQKLMVTAQGRTSVNETSAFVLQNCRIVAGPEYPVGDKLYEAFLGRPWKQFSRAIVMDSEIDGLIHPSGWSPWNETDAHLDTCWYGEVGNMGPGADLSRRVNWPGFKRLSIKEAEPFTPGKYMMGDEWIAGKGVPYDSGLTRPVNLHL